MCPYYIRNKSLTCSSFAAFMNNNFYILTVYIDVVFVRHNPLFAYPSIEPGWEKNPTNCGSPYLFTTNSNTNYGLFI